MRVGGAEVQLSGSLHGKTHNNWYKPFQSLNEGSLKFTLEVWELQCLTEGEKKKKRLGNNSGYHLVEGFWEILHSFFISFPVHQHKRAVSYYTERRCCPGAAVLSVLAAN